MKKTLLALGVILLFGFAILWFAASRSLSFSTGYYLEGENGTRFLIDGTSPIQLSNRTKAQPGSAMTNGDRILVLHDGVAESYPAQTGAYGIWKLRDGSIEEIPVSVLDSLMDLGWKFPGIERVDPLYSVSPFPTAVSWANYGDEELLWSRAVNQDSADSSAALPVLRFDSVNALDTFKTEIAGAFATQHGYDEMPSFEKIAVPMDADFFADHDLLLVYVWSGSCTWRYGVNRVDISDGRLTVHVQRTDNFEVGDCAMAGWFITVAVPREQLTGITAIDAVLDARTK